MLCVLALGGASGLVRTGTGLSEPSAIREGAVPLRKGRAAVATSAVGAVARGQPVPRVGPMGLGITGDIPICGRWNGRSRPADVGVVRRNTFHLRGGPDPITFGAGIENGDIPIVGDWNGDGTADVGVVRENCFFLRGRREPIRYGSGIAHGDIPIVGAWDGAHDQIGIVHGKYFFLRHGDGSVSTITFGNGFAHGDLPITGRWDGESRTQIGVVRGNVFHLRHSDGSVTWRVFGDGACGGDVPLVGDWTGTGRDGIGVARKTKDFFKPDGDVVPYGNGFTITFAPPSTM